MLDRNILIAAYNGTARNPEKNADTEIAAYERHVSALREELSAHAKSDAQTAYMNNALSRYCETYCHMLHKWARVHAGCMSAYIAGNGFRQVSRLNSKIDSADAVRRDLYAWSDAAISKIKRDLRDMRPVRDIVHEEVIETIRHSLRSEIAPSIAKMAMKYARRGNTEAVEAILSEIEGSPKLAALFTKRSAVWKALEISKQNQEDK